MRQLPWNPPSPTGNAGHPLVADSAGTRIVMGDPGWVNVRLRGVSGNGTDERTAIQAALDESLFVYFPETSQSYVVGSSLSLRSNHHVSGIGPTAPYGAKPQIKSAGGFNGPIINQASETNYVTIRNLAFQGRSASGSKGIYVASGSRWHVVDCIFDSFGDQALQFVAGVACTFEHLFIDNALLVTTGRSNYVGAIQVESQDFRLLNVEAGAPSSAIGNGYRAAILVSGDNGVVDGCIGQLSEAGIVITGGLNKVIANRADLNYGHGYVVTGSTNSIVANHSYRNSRDTDNTYDGFRVTGAGGIANCFLGNIVAGLAADTTKMRYGFNDDVTGSSGSDAGNAYIGNKKVNINGALYNVTGGSEHGAAGAVGRDFQAGLGGGHNTGHLVIGATHFWVDGSGNLRIKSSAPSSATDGTVVGTQT